MSEPWTLVQRSLFTKVLRVNDSASRAQYHCTAQQFLTRTKHSQALLRSVLAGTVADKVRSVVVPASGGDVMTAMTAFPLANSVTLISQEPLMPADPRKQRLLQAPLPPAALAQLSAIFACNRAGAYFFGLQLREFAAEMGLLPVLLVALSIGRIAVMNISISAGTASSLPSATLLACRNLIGSHSCSARHLVRIRYLRASLKDPATLPRLHDALRRWPEPQRPSSGATAASRTAREVPLRGLLVKSAETAFRGGGPSQRPAQDVLSAELLEHTDVLLQDTQSSIRWAAVQQWLSRPRPPAARAEHVATIAQDDFRHDLRVGAGAILPLGVYIGADEALEMLAEPERTHGSGTAKSTDSAELWAEHEALRRIFGLQARSMRGLRFGYCHGTLHLDVRLAQLLERRVPLAEIPAAGELNEDERGAMYYCGAILAWRAGAHAQSEPAAHSMIAGRAWAAVRGLMWPWPHG